MKYRRIILIILLSTFFLSLKAQENQGIVFYDGTYDGALVKAQKEKKQIFIDFYATWCVPCKRMSKMIFTKEEIGKYFNEKFVSLKLDAEKPENAELVKKYNIEAFPTLVFVSNNGSTLSVNVGGMSEDELMEAAKVAVGEAISFKQLYENYKADKTNYELQQALLLKAPAFLSAQEDMEAEKWLVRIQKLYRNYIKAKMGSSLINKKDYLIISALGGNSDAEIEEMTEFINNNLEAWKKEVGNPACYYIVENNDKMIEKLAKDGDSQYKTYLERIRADYSEAYSVLKYSNVTPYEKAEKYYTSLYNLYNSKDVDGYISVLSKLFELLGEDTTPNDYGKAAQDLYYAAGDKLKENHHMTAIAWLERALQGESSILDRINFLVMIGDSYKELIKYDISTQYYNQAYVESLQMGEMEMAQQMVQATIKRKLAVLELLQK